MGIEGCSDPSLKGAMLNLTVKYFQELRSLRLPNKSAVYAVISFLSLLAPIDSSISVSTSFQITESYAQRSLHSYCGQPGNVVHTLRKFSSTPLSIPSEAVRRAKACLQKVNEDLLCPSLVLMLQFIRAALNYWDTLNNTPADPVRPGNPICMHTSQLGSSFAEASFIKGSDEESVDDLSIYSMLKGHSPISKVIETPPSELILTLQDAFRAFLRSRLKCLKLTSRLIPIKAQALTKAAGSKSKWHSEFLQSNDYNPEEVGELFSEHRFKAEVLKAAALLG
jgi:hypothetical protein